MYWLLLKGIQLCVAYFRWFYFLRHASVFSQDFNDKIKLVNLRLCHISERGLVELSEQDFIGCKK